VNLPSLAGRKISIPASLRHNLGLKILSLLAAVVIWTAVRMQTDPVVERQLSMRVHTTTAPKGMQVLSIEPPQLDITLRGRESLLDTDLPQPARIVADISRAQVGSQSVPVSVTPLRSGIELVQDISGKRVQVEIDTVVTEARAVQAQLRGRPAEGFAAKGWQVQPNEVKITGPAARVKSVAEVLAVIDISEASATVKRDVVAQPRDENNFPVSGVEIEPAKATVNVSVEMVNTKTVPISPVIGTPPAGWMLSAVNVSPISVTIAGSGPALKSIDTVNTARVDVSDLRGTSAYSVPLDLPSGVRALGAASARVSVTLKPMRSSRPTSTSSNSADDDEGANGASGFQTDDPGDESDGHGGIERRPDGTDGDGTPDTPAPSEADPDGPAGDNGSPATDPEQPAGGGDNPGPPSRPRTTPPGGADTPPDGAR
jgi:YbbR domain-containing protein